MAIFALALVVLGDQAWQLGFYADDSRFLAAVPHSSLGHVLLMAKDYTVGRPLHIIWQALLFDVFGSAPSDLPGLHVVQAVFGALTAVLVYALGRVVGLGSWASALAAVTFAVNPNHDETTFWMSSFPMNIMSTLLALAYMVGSAVLVRRACGGRPWALPLLSLLLDVSLFPLALFTYEATFFFLLVAAVGKDLVLLLKRERGWSGPLLVVLGGVITLAYAGFDAHLKLGADQQGGPVAGQVTLASVLANIQVAIGMSGGNLLWNVIVHGELATASVGDWLIGMGVAAAVGMGLVSLAGNWQRIRDGLFEARGPAVLAVLALPVLGLIFWFLAYAPSLLWSIAPRHNYLPTVGSSVALGGLAYLLLGGLRRLGGRRVELAALVGLSAAAAVIAGAFVTAIAYDRGEWVRDYQLRVELYQSILQKGLVGPDTTTLALQGFPLRLPGSSSPFLGYETPASIQYVTGQAQGLEYLVSDALHAGDGYFIYLDRRRYADVALRYVPARNVSMLYFLQLDSDGLGYSRTPNASALDASSYYQVGVPVRVPGNVAAVSGGGSPQIERVTREGSGATVRLRVNGGLPSADTVLVAVPTAGSNEVQEANPAGEPFAVPITLAFAGDPMFGAPGTYDIPVGLSADLERQTTGLGLYGTSDDASVLLQPSVQMTPR